MGLRALEPIANAAQGYRLLSGLRRLKPLSERVRAVERLAGFVRGRLGAGGLEVLPVRSLLDGQGRFREGSASDLQSRWRLLARPSPSTDTRPRPLFQWNGVRFFQGRAEVPPRLTPGEVRLFAPDTNYFFLPWEQNVDLFDPQIAGAGGVFVGVGSVQNLTLSAVAKSSATVVFERDPFVALSLATFLSMVTRSKDLGDFQRRLLSIADPTAPMEPFLEGLPAPFVPQMALQIEMMRTHDRVVFSRQLQVGGKIYLGLLRAVRAYLERGPQSPLHDEDQFIALARRIRQGAVSVVYADLFSMEAPDLVYAALPTYPTQDPIRTVYLSNAPEMAYRTASFGTSSLLQLLAGPWTDPKGQVLMTSFGLLRRIGNDLMPKRDVDRYYYNCAQVADLVSLLEEFGARAFETAFP